MIRIHSRLAMTAFAVLTTLGVDARAQSQNNQGLPQQIQALGAQVAALQGAVTALRGQNTALQNQVNSLQAQLANAKNVLALAPFVSVDPNPENGVAGPNVTFKGVNLHLVSGSGQTYEQTATGLGNLIIGYDAPPVDASGKSILQPLDRQGSHNLVIGDDHKFTWNSKGGLLAGSDNTLNGPAASVVGGSGNYAQNGSTVVGGENNSAGGSWGVVVGGSTNVALGTGSAILGGYNNSTDGFSSTIAGGENNLTDDNANRAVVLGGNGNSVTTVDQIAPTIH